MVDLSLTLSSFRDGVLGKFTGEGKTDSSLDFTRREGRLLSVTCKLASLGSQSVEDVTDEGVEDGYTTLRDTGIGVDLLQDLLMRKGKEEDVRSVLLL